MRPGRELDALIAEEVMGDKRLPAVRPGYSTNISSAWRVVERLRDLHPDGWVNLMVGVGDGWHVSVSTGDQERGANASTAPHAICLAALAVLEEET